MSGGNTMRYPIKTRFIDRNSVLSEMDQFQLESMVWLKLAPIKQHIRSVRFEISQSEQELYGYQHSVRITTKLASGSVVETRLTRVCKEAAFMASVHEMKTMVQNRIRFETSWPFRLVQSANSLIRATLGSRPGAVNRFPDNCSGPAT